MTITCTDKALALDDTELGIRVYAADSASARSGSPLVLHLHGGAFTSGSLDNGRQVSTLLAEAGAIVMSADYPLAPKSSFPQTLQTIFRALGVIWEKRGKLGGRKSPLFIAGEEAGGNLAAGLALMARDQHTPPLAGQILLSPMLDPCLATRSIRCAEAGPVGCRWADGWHQYLGTADKASHPYAAPLGSSRLAGVAPALIVSAEDDPMRDESVSYAARLRAAGVKAATDILPAPTGWPCALGSTDSLTESWMAKLREVFAQFFAETAALLCRTEPTPYVL
jgi:acetyl esterase/lipase